MVSGGIQDEWTKFNKNKEYGYLQALYHDLHLDEINQGVI